LYYFHIIAKIINKKKKKKKEIKPSAAKIFNGMADKLITTIYFF